MNSNTRLQEQSQDISKKALRPERSSSSSLSKDLFEKTEFSKTIRDYALDTKFIKGMTEASLRPTQFGSYMIQDTAYLANAVKMYSEAAPKMEKEGKPDFALFYRKQALKYEGYYKEFLKTWNLESAEAVRVGPAFQTYMAYQQNVVENHPEYLPVAMLPCTMLWPWMVGSLITGTVNEQNLYYKDWFEPNKPRQSGQPSSTEEFVDKNKAAFDENVAHEIFCEGMVNEVNAFREVVNEAPFYINCRDP